MSNHSIRASALQKYYSALKSLDAFGQEEDFFDDVSNLDKFFSEFRNITFVIQKGLESKENKEVYQKLRADFLTGDILKWFVDTRNVTTKEHPFDLKKELIIDVYLPTGLYRISDTRLVVDLDASFDHALAYIRSVFFDKLHLVEVDFTTKIVFRENNSEIELYPKIKAGLQQMGRFIEAIDEHFLCQCEICTSLKAKTDTLFDRLQVKELAFINDYSFEAGKPPSKSISSEILFGIENKRITPLSELKTPLDSGFFGKNSGCIKDLFFKFIFLHIWIYQTSQHNIMPVFMIVYSDQTYKLLPFLSENRATHYRKVYEIINMPDFHDITALFYCGECYNYSVQQLPELKELPYSQRVDLARHESLMLTMIAKGNADMTIFFDTRQIDDMTYVQEQLSRAEWSEQDDLSCISWLNPIKREMNKQ